MAKVESSAAPEPAGAGAPLLTCVVTGGNRNLGFEACRQLALSPEVSKVVLTARSAAKADAAVAELARLTGKPAEAFGSVVLDLADAASVKTAIVALPERVDRICLNAGGYYRGMHAASGTTNSFATGLGHAVLIDGLLAAGKLPAGSRVVYSATEGVRPVLTFAGLLPTALTGHCFFDPEAAMTREHCDWLCCKCGARAHLATYARSKLAAGLHFAQMATERPEVHWLVASPGGSATGFGREIAWPVGCLLNHGAPVLRCIGNYQSQELAARRYVTLMTGAEKFPNGAVPMSPLQCGCLPCILTGEMVDNSGFGRAHFQNAQLKAKASAAVRRLAAEWTGSAGAAPASMER
jgi:NAD(P)-dependent dehydrogenase (short-subunit alcohol dehydrogenase family)